MSDPFAPEGAKTLPLIAVTSSGLDGWLKKQPAAVRKWVKAMGFTAAAGRHLAVPDGAGAVTLVLVGRGKDGNSMWDFGGLASALPAGRYRLEGVEGAEAQTAAALAWALGCYRFGRYKKAAAAKAQLVWPKLADRARVEREAAATALVRDLVNTPANDMGPADLAQAARKVAAAHKAKITVIEGAALLKKGFPAIHAVGRAAGPKAQPRLIDLTWGRPNAPKVTLVGKGVCFDTGGLDIKPAGSMKIMKKDMGGAAHALALGQLLMAAKAPIRLRVLIPAVENSISGDAMRPLDIITTRRGTTVEIANTDAEGRVILSDALDLAVSESPALLLDFATLTGAARVALGPDLPALFANDEKLAADILAAGERVEDPLWRLPLWSGYRDWVDGAQADINNAPEGGHAGAITAALFLEHFATPAKGKAVPWAHVDLFAWNPKARPGRPAGGEAMCLRAMAEMILSRFARRK